MKVVMHMAKAWKVTAAYSYSPGTMDDYYVIAETLYDAFFNYYKLYGTKHLVAIHITEVKRDE